MIAKTYPASDNNYYEETDVIIIQNLQKLGAGFKYSQIIEGKIGSLIERYYPKLKFSDQTIGNNPDYDYRLADTLVEQKVSGLYANTGDKQFLLSLEYERGDGRPSGITLSKSEAFLFITPGFNSHLGCMVGKLRLFPTSTLKKKTQELVAKGIIKTFGSKTKNSGAKHVELSSRDLPQIWLGDIPIIMDDINIPEKRKTIGYVCKKFLEYNQKLEKRLMFIDKIDFNTLYE